MIQNGYLVEYVLRTLVSCDVAVAQRLLSTYQQRVPGSVLVAHAGAEESRQTVGNTVVPQEPKQQSRKVPEFVQVYPRSQLNGSPKNETITS